MTLLHWPLNVMAIWVVSLRFQPVPLFRRFTPFATCAGFSEIVLLCHPESVRHLRDPKNLECGQTNHSGGTEILA